MDEEIRQNSVEQKRAEFEKQIADAIANPTRDTDQMTALVRGMELNVKHEVVLNGFSVEEARIFLKETRNALEQAIDQDRNL